MLAPLAPEIRLTETQEKKVTKGVYPIDDMRSPLLISCYFLRLTKDKNESEKIFNRNHGHLIQDIIEFKMVLTR